MPENRVYTVEEMRQGLTRHFGFTDFKSTEQAEAVFRILHETIDRNDVFLNMAPKAGKSIAFQLPLLMQENNKLVVVITPLIANIYNHVRILKARNIDAETINSTTDYNDRDDIRSRLEENKLDIKFLYITPQMAFQMLGNNRYEFNLLRKLVNNQKVSYFVIDEAQTIFQNDFNFRSDYIQMFKKLRREFNEIRWIAASTYVPADVEQSIELTLNLRDPFVICQPHSCDQLMSVQHFVHNKDDKDEEPFDLLVQIIHAQRIDGRLKTSGIIFCRQKHTVLGLFQALCQAFPEQILCYTGDTRLDERQEILRSWFDGTVPLIITNPHSFGLGIDKENVGFVIFWDIPKSPIDYFIQYARITSIQERACHMFYEGVEYSNLKFLMRDNNVDLQNLERIRQYGHGTISIEQLLQSYIDRPYF